MDLTIALREVNNLLLNDIRNLVSPRRGPTVAEKFRLDRDLETNNTILICLTNSSKVCIEPVLNLERARKNLPDKSTLLYAVFMYFLFAVLQK